jgi:hypothetical protein
MSPSSSQLFKKQYPFENFKHFIEDICLKTDKQNFYLYTKACFKRANLSGVMFKLYEDIAPYYHVSKQKYADKTNITYKSSINLFRQVCKLHKIPIETSIKYDKSTYELEYIINISNHTHTISDDTSSNITNMNDDDNDEIDILTAQEQSIQKLLDLLTKSDL